MFGGGFDSASIDKKIAEKEALSAEPNFWEDQTKAQKVMAEIRKLKNRVEPWRALIRQIDDIEAMFELAQESGDKSDEDETRQMLICAQAEFERLNVLNLLSGEVDGSSAFLSFNLA